MKSLDTTRLKPTTKIDVYPYGKVYRARVLNTLVETDIPDPDVVQNILDAFKGWQYPVDIVCTRQGGEFFVFDVYINDVYFRRTPKADKTELSYLCDKMELKPMESLFSGTYGKIKLNRPCIVRISGDELFSHKPSVV